MWLDSHAHLTAPAFDADRREVLRRAERAGVEAVVAIGAGYGVAHNERAVALAAEDPRVFATVGVHPHDASQLDAAAMDRVRALAVRERVVGVGECGLDYHYDRSPRPAQRDSFAWQVALAREIDRPVSIHVRGDGPEAYDELLDIWTAEGRGDVDGVLHCFTGSYDVARRALDLRLCISFSGILTFRNDGGLREVARRLPLERLLVETDCPLLAPQGFRGRRNEPAHVTLVGETLAVAKGCRLADVAATTTRSARALFRLPP